MAFFVSNSKASVYAWKMLACFETSVNVIQSAPMADFSFGFTEGSLLLQTGSKHLR